MVVATAVAKLVAALEAAVEAAVAVVESAVAVVESAVEEFAVAVVKFAAVALLETSAPVADLVVLQSGEAVLGHWVGHQVAQPVVAEVAQLAVVAAAASSQAFHLGWLPPEWQTEP